MVSTLLLSIIRLLVNDVFNRVFSRIVVLLFEKLTEGKDSLKKSIAMQTELKATLQNVMRSIGVIIELRTAFQQRVVDDMFQEAIEVIEEASDLDMRTRSNYALLVCTTAKVKKQKDFQFVCLSRSIDI